MITELAVGLGAFAFLTKPFRIEELELLIGQAFGSATTNHQEEE